MAMLPLAPIITVTKNRAGFLKRNIQSVLEQSYPLVEHVVVDGASGDDSLRVIKEYETVYRLRWISEPDKNHAEAYSKGIKLSKGSIVGFLNSMTNISQGLYRPSLMLSLGSQFQTSSMETFSLSMTTRLSASRDLIR